MEVKSQPCSKESPHMPILPTEAANDNHDLRETALAAALTILRDAVEASLPAEVSFAEREAETLRLGNELMRRSLTLDLEQIVAAHGEADVLVDGRAYRPHQPGTKKYPSLVGALPVTRWTYREVGVRNGPTVVPLELAAGLMEGATPALAHRVVLGHGDSHSRRLKQELDASFRSAPSRSALENLGKALGTSLASAAVEIEAIVREQEELPAGTHCIALGLDRTSAPMREVLPGATAPERTAKHVRERPTPYEVNYRMAYTGTVAFADSEHRVLRTLRYGASAEEGPHELLTRMMGDVRRARAQRPNLPVLVVQDAAKEMWTLLTEALESEPSVRSWYEVIDHYHALEHLADIARAMDVEASAKLDEWKQALREDDDAIDGIREEVRAELTEPYLPPFRIALEEQLIYLDNNHERLHYAALRDRGFPIGSGPTEGACKSLVTVRCKRSGQSWSSEGLRAVLAARTQILNDRLPTVVTLLRLHNYTAHVRRAA